METNVVPFDGTSAPVLEGTVVDQVQVMEKEAVSLLATAKVVIVKTPEDYQKAGAVFASLKKRIKEVEAERVKRTGPLNESLRLTNADFKRITETLQAALRPYEAGMLAFKQEEERVRRAAEEEARKERERIEAEARAKAAEEMRKIEEARKAEEAAQVQVEAAPNPIAAYLAEEKRKQAEADAQAAREAAVNSLREAAMAKQAVVATAAPKATAAGTSFRTNYKFRIVDESLIPREFMLPNEQLLGQIAKTAKGTKTIPGVEFYAENSIGGR